MYERLLDINPTQFSCFKGEFEEEIRNKPTAGEHIGAKIAWRHRSAPLNLKVICFGNSFFERGGSPSGLSWWFKRLFSEFHFVWSPFVDNDYVRNEQPDIVVCQTIERFLMLIPRS